MNDYSARGIQHIALHCATRIVFRSKSTPKKENKYYLCPYILSLK
ncbi:hypothetical protein HMPREF9999_01502 [Alloprevotella sp. oral taxon 473 str. F0040]|nr:hypothetical protein HMPREF9999_01502 [Alloprevotella sp. oral taxon 473 str. F0040]